MLLPVRVVSLEEELRHAEETIQKLQRPSNHSKEKERKDTGRGNTVNQVAKAVSDAAIARGEKPGLTPVEVGPLD